MIVTFIIINLIMNIINDIFSIVITVITSTIIITSPLSPSPPPVPYSETVLLKCKEVSRGVAKSCGSLLRSSAIACSSLLSLSRARDCAGSRRVFAEASRGAETRGMINLLPVTLGLSCNPLGRRRGCDRAAERVLRVGGAERGRLKDKGSHA